jgi:hypothetical protein
MNSSHDETLNHKPHFLLIKCAKTYLQQWKNSKFSGRGPPDPHAVTGKWKGGQRTGGHGSGWEGRKDGMNGGGNSVLLLRGNGI